jgi:2-haloacid dehalogenase
VTNGLAGTGARVKACVFDAYGTLLDLGSAIAPCAAALGEAAEPLLALWRRKQLEYTWLRTLMGRHVDFETVTRDALEYALESLGVPAGDFRPRLARAFRVLDAFPDAAPMLARLRHAGLSTIVLSNGDPGMLHEALAHAGLAPLLDHVISVQPLRAYKPAPQVYAMAIDFLAVEADTIAFVSGNAWDAAGAASAGLRAILIQAPGTPQERLPGTMFARVSALSEVPALFM